MNGTLGDEVFKGTHQEVHATITEHNFHVCRATTLQLSPLYSFCGEGFQERTGCVKNDGIRVILVSQYGLFQKLLGEEAVLIAKFCGTPCEFVNLLQCGVLD